MNRYVALVAAAVALVLLAWSEPRSGEAQTTYVPRPPEQDSLLFKPEKKDPRVAPRDAWNPFSKDPHVPKNEYNLWTNNDYFAVEGDAWQTHLLDVVENGHLGSKKNPRGFWSYYNIGRLDLALPELKYVLWVYPNHPRGLFLICMLAKTMKEPGVPIAFFEKALRLFPSRAVTHAQYGSYLVDIGETTQGMLELEKALQLDPNNFVAIAALDKAKTRSGMAGMPDSLLLSAPPPDRTYMPRR